MSTISFFHFMFFCQAEDGIRDLTVTGVQTCALPIYNDHYAMAEANGVDLKATLVATTQSTVYGLPVEAASGIWTTRGGSSAFFIMGTNRAQFRFTMINHLCHDMETVMDNTRPTDRIRQDVARTPGGDSRIFLNNCVGCHSGLDTMAQAFAYYNYDTTGKQLLYTANMVQPKYLINSQNFGDGFVTPDNSWSNRWRDGPNATLGWDGTLPGSGDRKSTRLNSSHSQISYAVFCLKKKRDGQTARSTTYPYDRDSARSRD